MNENIIVRGARQHNLKNITVEIPRNKLTVITGLSGSGKSTLAFDTIYAEGQRRYVESLSAYARQFLGLMDKPDVDSIDGLSPAISIEQKTTSKNPRSTVGTVTEIYDYLRLLFARVGVSYCPLCHSKIKPQSAENIINLIMAEQKKQVMILAPIIRGKKGTHEKVFEDLKKEGFTRVRVNSLVYRLESVLEELKLERYEKHYIEAVVDRVEVSEEERLRISDAVEQALQFGQGTLIILDIEAEKTAKESYGKGFKKEMMRGVGETVYSSFGACPEHPQIVFEQAQPRMFSFNSPFGACPDCHGIGQIPEISPQLVIPNKKLSIADGAIAVYGKMDLSWRSQQLGVVGKKFGFDLFTPIEKFTERQLHVLLYGTEVPISGKWSTGAKMSFDRGWEGIIPQTERLYKQTESEYRKGEIEKFMLSRPCSLCKGKRLNEKALAIKIKEKSIIDVTDMSVEQAASWFLDLPEQLSEKEKFIAQQVLKEINDRLGFLNNVGLGYLTLSRSAGTLSGGEAQRIRLATQIGSNLMGVLYVLDEPSIGLHQRDNEKLIGTLKKLRNLGNTLIVVEHDEDTIREADYVLDIGPGAGVHGGHIVASGTPKEIASSPKSLTGEYLSGKKKIEVPQKRRKGKSSIILKGASENNLQEVSVSLPTGVLLGVSGVSGSGKSSLINQTLVPLLKQNFGMVTEKIGAHKSISIPKELDSIIVIDQDPIGKTPRSNPATYIKVFDEIRKLFSTTKESNLRGYKEGRFSFNVSGGRCETCRGDGLIKIEMNFLPDVYVQCDDCKGKRYNRETLEITYKGKNIAEVLDMDVETAVEFFEHHSSIHRKLKTLLEVGLGYIKLGQSSTTLSGGESQRIKLTKELAKFKKGNTVYVLDEPTTGLHFEDVNKLVTVLNRLVDKGNSVIVIEHNLDVLKCCDWIVDMGPEGGDKGGSVVCEGSPEEIAKHENSHTARFLRTLL
ncbi:excinuclease ABC subunit UvrA [Candidatus Woesearchaeota archaeon]|nr:excinuclease ABC subunit UvrA [Nanoarchaeota archaeon]MCB9370011.1 excinuclease ABC subunit UvrA [Candidatus Woesearchaeota archaeon]USN44943.1 MAG: excinuclease ABC subunit UvrA [Candidatus Woesearchaeota archaeon]